MVDFLGGLQKVGDFAGSVSDAAYDVQLNALRFDDPAAYQEIIGRQEELDLRKQERSHKIEQRRREEARRETLRGILGSPEVLGSLSQSLGLPPELISGAGSIEELGALGRLMSQAAASPSAVREFQYFQGLDRPQQESYLAVKRAQQIKDIGGQLVSIDPQTGLPTVVAEKTLAPADRPEIIQAQEQARVLGGGKITPIQQREYNIAESQLAAQVGLQGMTDSAENINSVIDKVMGQAGNWTTGLMGAATGIVAGTPAFDLRENMKTIEADAAFSTLQAMREASKTGGALGAISERELGLLGAARAALSASQSPAQFKENLKRYKTVRASALRNTKAAYKQEFGSAFSGIGGQALTQAPPSGTVSLEDFLKE